MEKAREITMTFADELGREKTVRFWIVRNKDLSREERLALDSDWSVVFYYDEPFGDSWESQAARALGIDTDTENFWVRFEYLTQEDDVRYYWLETSNPDCVVMIPSDDETAAEVRRYSDDDVPHAIEFNLACALSLSAIAEARSEAAFQGLALRTERMACTHTRD